MLPLISTSVLSTLRPLGAEFEDLDDEAGALLWDLGAAGLELGAASLGEEGPVDTMSDSGFCPITF